MNFDGKSMRNCSNDESMTNEDISRIDTVKEKEINNSNTGSISRLCGDICHNINWTTEKLSPIVNNENWDFDLGRNDREAIKLIVVSDSYFSDFVTGPDEDGKHELKKARCEENWMKREKNASSDDEFTETYSNQELKTVTNTKSDQLFLKDFDINVCNSAYHGSCRDCQNEKCLQILMNKWTIQLQKLHPSWHYSSNTSLPYDSWTYGPEIFCSNIYCSKDFSVISFLPFFNNTFNSLSGLNVGTPQISYHQNQSQAQYRQTTHFYQSGCVEQNMLNFYSMSKSSEFGVFFSYFLSGRKDALMLLKPVQNLYSCSTIKLLKTSLKDLEHSSLNGPDKNEFRSNQKTYNTLPKKLPSSKSVNNDEKSKNNSNSNALILGREFEDDDNKESDDSNVSLSIIDLLSYPEDVLKRPGLVSILIIHANEQPNDLNVLMLYYACVMYKNIIQKQDFKGDSSVLANEIITTFILDKSPLFVSFEFDIVEEMIKNLRSSKNLNIIFDPLISNLFKRLQSIIESVKGKIQRGTLLQTDLPKLENEENKNAEMTLLQKTLVPIFNKSSKDSEVSDSVTAKLIGLATMYQYFYNPSTSYSISTRSRSTDGINNLGMQGKPLSIAEMYKINIFFSSHQQKISSSIRKKFKNISGHNITEATCKEPVICSVCEGLLWGPCPQGLYCSSCQSHCHMNCKKKLKNCPRKSRKTAPITGTKEPQDKTSSSFLGRLSRKSSTSSIKNSNSQQNSDGPQNLGNISFNSASLHPDEKTNSNTNEENFGVFKAKSEDQLHRLISNAERFTSTHETSPLSLYNSIDNSSFGVNNNESSNVEVTDLIQDESLNDPDMKVDESFDAGSEIQTIFPNLDPETDKKRLIVLLEFYHKTRYILMNLKRFDYKLVKCWPSDYRTYAKALSLDCIDPFVQLIKSLVTTIRECITEQDFVDLEKAVYDWLSKDNDKQLKKWISLSSNLCCTNSLYLVKQLRQTTMRNIPELIKLMNVKMHKMVIVEELTQIRPLLISLPLIVKNIIKCLSKSDQQYLDQLAVWKDVSVKMDYLCEYIDRCCIPLVDWVNNGSISRRLDKTDLLVRTMEAESIESNIINFFIDFPRTMFHYQVLDFKMAKIFTWSRNTKRVSNEYQINYFIKGAEVLLIFYQEFILVLQKENDHFYLKPIKPNKNVTERIVPIIETTKFFATNGGQEEDYYLLNIIKKNSKDPTLIRVGFTRKEFADHYLEFFGNDFNLSRSISIYKLNDVKEIPVANFQIESNNNLPGIKLRSSESFSSQKSAIAPSSLIQPDIQNQENLPSEILATESEPVAEKELNNSVELSEGLSNASTTISDLKKDVCKYLNIEEEQYDTHLELIINETPKTLKDVFLMFYSVCSPIVDLTRHLILPDSEESVSVPSSQKKDIRKTLFYLSTLLRNIDCLNDIDEDQIDSNSPTEAKLSTDYPPLVADSVNVEEPNKTISNEIVQEIISDIISESVDLTDSVPEPVVMRNSYKYIPDKCQIASTRSTTERSALYLTPSYIDPSIPNDETITTTRAQIVLSRNSNNMNM